MTPEQILIADERYDVHPDGTIWRYSPTPRRGSPNWRQVGCKGTSGYQIITYRRTPRDKPITIYVHRIVYFKFKGKIPSDKQVDHRDFNTQNNHIANLRLKTASANARRKRSNKISLREAEEIRTRLQSAPWVSQRTIAREFGISQTTVSSVVNSKVWVA